MTSDPISIMRAHAPRTTLFSDTLKTTWKELVDSGSDLSLDLQSHRYHGAEEDRSAGVAWIGNRITPQPASDRLMLTNGTMNSILYLLHTLVGSGNVLLTEELTFPSIYRIAEVAGIRVRSVRIDEHGLMPDDFEKQCIKFKPKAVYVNCAIHSPMAYVTSEERRLELIEIAHRHGICILEDEAQSFYVDNAPRSFATLAPDITWYLLPLSKCLPPGLRMSFTVAPSKPALDSVLDQLSPFTTWHPAPIVASLVTRWINTGKAQELFTTARTEVRKRQAIVSEILSCIHGFRGSSGLLFWVPAPAGVESDTFCEALHRSGVLVRPSSLYSIDHRPRFSGIRGAVGDPQDIDEIRKALEVVREVYDATAK